MQRLVDKTLVDHSVPREDAQETAVDALVGRWVAPQVSHGLGGQASTCFGDAAVCRRGDHQVVRRARQLLFHRSQRRAVAVIARRYGVRDERIAAEQDVAGREGEDADLRVGVAARQGVDRGQHEQHVAEATQQLHDKDLPLLLHRSPFSSTER